MKSVEGRMKKFNFLKEIFIITFPKFDVAIKGIIWKSAGDHLTNWKIRFEMMA